MSVIPAEDVCTCTEKCAAGEVNTSCPVCKNDLKGCIGKEKPEETEKPEEPEPSKKIQAAPERLSLSSLPCLQ